MSHFRPARLLASVVAPPFKGLWFIIWIYFVLCFLIQPDSQILRGNFPDPDDYLYLTQAIDLIHGQNWFDLVQHRMNPPMGTHIYFSRILCLLYAVFIYILYPFLGTIGSATITAAFIPLVYLALLFVAIRWAAQPFMNRSWMGVTAYVTLFATSLMYQFTPGHVDHHGLDAVIGVIAFGACIRMIEAPSVMRWPILMGIVLAFGMAIRIEVLPLLLILASFTGVWAVISGGAAARAGFIFGTALLLASMVFLFVTQGPDHLFDPDVLTHSIVYVVMTGGMAICFAVAKLMARFGRPFWRYVLSTGCAIAIGLAFLHHFPALRNGPYGGMDPSLTALVFENITEAMPIIKADRPWTFIVLSLIWPSMAIAASGYFLWQAKKSTRWIWGLLTFILVGLVGLGTFYQIRLMVFAQAFCVIPLALILQTGSAKARELFRGCRSCVWVANLGLAFLVGPLPMVLLPALINDQFLVSTVLMFPNQETDLQTANDRCDLQGVAQVLDSPAYFGNRPRIIMNTIDDGPELLFRTSHKILAASYEWNIDGDIDSTKFFTTRDPKEAEEIARRHGVELVVLCRFVPQMFIYVPSSVTVSSEPRFFRRLTENKIPGWLKQINSPLLGNMLLFEVLPDNKNPGNFSSFN